MSEPLIETEGLTPSASTPLAPRTTAPPALEPRRWSSTRLKMYMTCPRQYRYAYVDLIPSIPTAPLVFGRVVHETLCFVQEYQMEKRRLPNFPDVWLHFGGLWGQALSQEQPFFRENGPLPNQYRDIGSEILRGYLADPANAAIPIAVELAFEIQVGKSEIGGSDNNAPYKLTGIVDRVEQGDDGLVVVDFKSGQRKPKASDVQGDLQFILYAFAIEQMFGQNVERVCYSHLRDSSCIDIYPEEKEFARLKNEVLPLVSGSVEREEFAPVPGYYCNWCDFRELCRAENKLRWESQLAKEAT